MKQDRNEKYYADLFKAALEEDRPVYSTSNPDKRLVIADGERFRQCWTDTPTRKTFPKYWFISDRCNLISMESGEPKWIEGYKKNKTGKCYKYIIYDGDTMQKKNIEAHNLVALVFESEVYGRASELLEQNGVFSFGTKSKEKLSNTGHHVDSCRSNNTPNNIQIITNAVHTLIDRIPNPNGTGEQEIEFMQELGELAAKEEPNKITVLFTGYTYDPKENNWYKDGEKSIHAVNKITLSPYAANQLISILNEVRYE